MPLGEHTFATDSSLSNISLPAKPGRRLLEESSGSLDKATVAMRQAINTYLLRYYDSVQVDISTTEEDPDISSTKVRMSLQISVIQDGVEYQVSRLISLVDGRFRQFINTNNNPT